MLARDMTTTSRSGGETFATQQACLGFGTAPLMPDYGIGGAATSEVSDRLTVLRAAVDAGLTFIDTASAYGDVELLLGQLAPLCQAHRVRVCTKLQVPELRNGLTGSLRRLSCERVYAVLAHSVGMPELLDSRMADSMMRIKAEGHAALTGASTYGVGAARRACQQPWCDMVQVEHHILNPSVVRVVAGLKRPGQQMVARSVLCRGLLTDRRSFAKHLDRDALTMLDRLEVQARDWGFSLPELAIRFALDTPGIDVVLVGIGHLRELGTALSALRREPLTAWQMQSLADFDRSFEEWSHPEHWPVAA